MRERVPNIRLRAWRDAKHWTRAEMAEAINRAGERLNESITCDVERIRRWEVGETQWPQPPYRRVLEEVTGERIDELGFIRPSRNDQLVVPERLASEETITPFGAEAELFDTMELARMAGLSEVGSGAVEAINEAVDLLSRAYPSVPAAQLKERTKRRLHSVMRMLGGRITLAQHRELLVSAGWLSVLLGCLHYDLGEREQAEAARQAAFNMGKEAGHSEIMAWTREMASWFAMVENRYEEAALHAQAGQDMLTSPTSATVQLILKEAQALARVGDRYGADEALSRAARTLDQLPRPEHPEHHFVFDHAKWLMYAATCYGWLGDDDRAEEHALELIEVHARPDGTSKAPLRTANAYIDLGIIHARRGDLEGATAHGVAALQFERKSNADLLGRAAELGSVLQQRYQRERAVQEFYERYKAACEAIEVGM
jgi:tetratricopeptide (TPR) repeat protein